jgi:Tat protein secretion system quality control protein TatD with DNase activity
MATLPLVDSHVHLDDPRARTAAAPRALGELRDAGWRGAVVAGYGPDRDDARAAELLATPGLTFARGWHPWWLAEALQAGVDVEAAWHRLADEAASSRGALGEIGLDRGRRGSAPLSVQRLGLSRALALARTLDRPVILHAVGWHGHLLGAVREADAAPGGTALRGVVHRFGGSAQTAGALVERGLHVSLAPDALRWPMERLAAVTAAIGEPLLFETDFDGHRGTYLAAFSAMAALVERVAQLRRVPAAALADAQNARTRALFGESAPGSVLSGG